MPKVSVVIPAYNAEKFITETLQSVLNQTFQDFEVIVVNDGSQDKTPEIVQEFCNQDQRVQLINKANSGVSDTRNLGMSLAKGEYIALLDADDLWMPTYLEKKVHFLENHKDISYVGSYIVHVDESGSVIKKELISWSEDLLNAILELRGVSTPVTLLFKKECLRKGIKFEKSLTTLADKHFVAQLSFHFKGYLIPEFLWKYRNVAGSMSKSLKVHEHDCLLSIQLYDELGFYPTKSYKRYCASKTYLMLAGSWWKDGNNKIRGLKYIFKSFFTHPKPLLEKVFKQIL